MELSDYEKLFNKEKDVLRKLNLARKAIDDLSNKLSVKDLLVFFIYIIKNAHYPKFEGIRAFALYSVGTYFHNISNFHEALEYLFESLRIYEDIDDKIFMSRVKNNIAVVYTAIGQTEKALLMYEKLTSESYCEENSYTNYASLLIQQNQEIKALELLNKSLEIVKKSNDVTKIFNVLIEFINLYNKLNQPEKSIETIKPFLFVLDQIISVRQKGFAYLNISESYLLLENYLETENWLNKALEISEMSQHNELLWFTYSFAIDFYKKINNLEKALFTCEKKQLLTEKIYKNQLKEKISEIEFRKNEKAKKSKSQNLNDKTIQMASLGVMGSGITHEINQPLNAIMIDAQALLYKDDIEKVLPDSYRHRIQYIIEASERISNIIQHIRSYWVNKDGLIREEFDVNQIVTKTISFIEQQIKSHGINLRIRLYPDNLIITGTTISLEQIIINLIVNAIHALDSIESRDKKIIVSTHLQKDEVSIFIDDNGSGIPEEIADTLFEPFATTKESTYGSGLGLALVKNFAQDLNARINYQKSDFGGCRFIVSLPLVRRK